MKIYGVDNIPKYGSVIVASNHLSYLDPVVLGIAARRKLNFVAKEELFDYFLFGDLISFVGAFPLGKKGVESAKAIKEAIRRLRKGKAVVIFPEGTRSLTGKIQKGTSGVGLLACKTESPVVPTFIFGTDKALPLKAKFVRFFNPIKVYFGEAVKPSVDNKQAYQQITNKVMDEIRRLAKQHAPDYIS